MTFGLAIVDDPRFDEHRPSGSHPERPERLGAARRAAARVAERVGRIDVGARPASDEELARVHTLPYIERLGQAAGKWHYWDADTYCAPGSVQAARCAAGGAVELVEGLLASRVARGVALLRPPGHHARPGGAMGFCLLNNIAVAAAHARARGAERVLIVDFDVHHGNGTEEVFYRDPSVLFVSLHQFPFYPGTGEVSDVGAGDGRGYTLNVPLSAGASDDVYRAAFARIVAPLAADYRPELVLMSAGFDAHADDPLAEMELSAGAYADMVRIVLAALPPDTKVGMVLEGGYDLDALEASLEAALEALVVPPTSCPSPTPNLDPRREGELERAERVAASRFSLA